MAVAKRQIRSTLALLVFPAVIALLMVGCGSSMEIPSSWTSTPAVVNDSSESWYGTLTPIKDTQLSLGVLNDTGYVYLCLVAPQNQFRREIMAPGLTLWFESENGQKMGIHYPMGLGNQPRPENGQGDNEPEQRGQFLQQALNELEILGPGKNDRNLLSTAELRGIKVKVRNVGSQSMYELKVPLHPSADQPYAVGVNPGSALKLEIQSGKLQARRPEGMSEGGEGRGEGGGRGGRRGGFGGGYGGARGGGERGEGGGFSRGNRPSQIDQTVKVQLVTSETSTQR